MVILRCHHLIQGGVIGIHIHWECNLDYDVSYCVPVYSFSRIDSKNAKIAKGLNFRFVS